MAHTIVLGQRMEKRTHFRTLVSFGLVAGAVLGAREGLTTLAANVFVQPEQYFLVYLAVPLLTWMLLAMLVLVLATIGCLVLRPVARLRLSLPIYAAVLVSLGMLSILIPWSGDTTSRLSAVGFDSGLFSWLAVSVAILGLTGAAAVLVGGTVHACAGAISRWVFPLALGLLGVAMLLFVPVLGFFLTDWKWAPMTADGAPSAGDRPNVLLISIDTLRADHLGRYGGPAGLTPHLDLIAADGVTFLETISSSPWTLPAMASVMTGLYPYHHRAGIITNRRNPLGRSALPTDTWTLASALQAQGYRTHAIVTNPYLALSYGLGEGFESYESITIESEIFLSFRDTTAFRLVRWLWPDVVVGDRGETVSTRARAWLEHRSGRSPFFLWLHYIDPHPPYAARGVDATKTFRTDSVFGSGAAELPDLALRSPDVARLRSGEIRLSEEGKDLVRKLYRTEVRAVDAAVGKVVDFLDVRGLRDDTLVVVVADHGEEFWEHGSVEHGHTLYDELLRVPWILRWPGHLPREKHVDALVRIVDVAPTILDLLNVAIPDELDGRSTVPLLSGNQSTARVAMAENMLFSEERTAIRTANHKYIRWQDGREEVYDLRADPGERINLVALPEIIRPLRLLSDAIVPPPGTAGTEINSPAIDARTKHALEALGYLH